jgi:hypothetical protein
VRPLWGKISGLIEKAERGTDRLGVEKGKNLKFENFFLPLFCAIFGKKSQEKWIKKERDFGQSPERIEAIFPYSFYRKMNPKRG